MPSGRFGIAFGLGVLCLTPLAHGDDYWYLVDDAGVYSLHVADSTTPTDVTFVGNLGLTGQFVTAIDFTADGALYAISYIPAATPPTMLYEIDQATGQALPVGDPGLTGTLLFQGLAYDPVDDRILGTAYGPVLSNGLRESFIYSFDRITGAATLELMWEGPYQGTRSFGFAMDACGRMLLHDSQAPRLGISCAGRFGFGPSFGFSLGSQQLGVSIDWSRDGQALIAGRRGSDPAKLYEVNAGLGLNEVGVFSNDLAVVGIAIEPATGSSGCLELEDCDANDVPDVCERNPETDCDGNEILDVCEGPDRDCDTNGAIDTCEIFSGDFLWDAPPLLRWARVVDFDKDGLEDLAYTTPTDESVFVALATGSGLGTPVVLPLFGEPERRSVAAADFDGDGNVDLAVGVQVGNGIDKDQIRIFWGNGDGTFASVVTVVAASDPNQTVTADFDGDGDLDILFLSRNFPFENARLLCNLGNRAFLPETIFVGLLPSSPQGLDAGDFDEDGYFDIVLTDRGVSPEMGIIFGSSTGFSDTVVWFPGVVGNEYPAVSDVNRDGHVDVVTAGVAVWFGDGEGNLASPMVFPASESGSVVYAVDLTGDGVEEILQVDASSQGWTLFDTSSGVPVEWLWRHWTPGEIWVNDFADLDDDDRNEIVVLRTEDREFFVYDVALDDCDFSNGLDACEVLEPGRDIDGNGVLDACEAGFVRGSCDGDEELALADAIVLLQFLFGTGGAPPPPCMDACDATDDGMLSLSDAITLLDRLFSGGGPLPLPEVCGPDPTMDGLDCVTPPCP